MSERTILVIEDDPLNRKLVHALLSLGGYRVLEAGSAEDGLALARENPPDCILMDIRLPGMDGLSATRLLKQDATLRTIPVIALTAFAMSGDEQKAIEAGLRRLHHQAHRKRALHGRGADAPAARGAPRGRGERARSHR